MEQVKAAAPDGEAGPAKKSTRATAQYPYFNLTDSVEVGRKIHENAGGSCSQDQLASYLGYKSTNSGTFQTRLSAAKQFGFVRIGIAGLAVTERAMKIIAPVLPEDAVSAKVDAFLSVDLFSKVYEKYKNGNIPPKVGMRNHLSQAYGLPEDRLDPAVRVLFESADQAGMFPAGDQTRLVRPALKASAQRQHAADADPQPANDAPQRSNSGGGEGGPPGVHTAILGLLRELPPAGSRWPKKNKDRFVKAFLATLEFVYQDDEGDEP